MMAACHAAAPERQITVLERNTRCGVKLNLTGKGRCNLTNNCDVNTLVENTLRGGKFLYSAYSAFTPQDTMEFFERLGVPLKTERGNRVYPASDQAKDVSGALQREMRQLGVTVSYTRVREILASDGKVTGVNTDQGVIEADRIILCAGGLSYPATGSSGDGYRIAKVLGHSVVRTRPSLVPLLASGRVCSRLEGLSLKNVGIQIENEGRVLYRDFGEMLFTGQGVSGPIILSASAHLYPEDFPCRLLIDLKPALDEKTLDRRLLRDFSEENKRDFINSLDKLLPTKLIPVIVERSQIPPRQKVHEITKNQREKLTQEIKRFTLELFDTAPYEEAVATAGGVTLSEINPKTMESKLINGMYFAGEVIDADAYTGGFNLQIAWSSAVCAARWASSQEDLK